MPKVMFLGANGSIQGRESGNTSLLISSPSATVLVDCSTNLEKAVSSDIDALLLTHEHIDHVYGIPSLLHQMWLSGRKKPLDILVPEGMESLVEGMIGIFALREKKGIYDIHIRTDVEITYGDLHIQSFSTKHTPLSRGFVFQSEGKKFVYAADTAPIEDIPSTWMDADLYVQETTGLWDEALTVAKKLHSTGKDAGCAARRMKAKKLLLCHLPKDEETKVQILQEARREYPEAEIPQILKEYTI